MNSHGMIPEPPQHVATISDNAALTTLCHRLCGAEWIVVDTEFLRERTYYAELCLVQLAIPDEIALIDIQAISDLQPLAALMAHQDTLKIFHAADQDVEVLQQALGTPPAPIFDTQVAATLTGMDAQTGYARMIENLLGIRLPKTQTRTDWSRRPLSPQALAYAADDVRYLAVAYPMLRAQLQAQGRLQWAEVDSHTLAQAAQQAVDPASAWQRIKSWHRLEPAQQQVLAALAQWRETQAIHANRPRKWILSDDALLTLARYQPADTNALANIRSLPHKTARRHGEALLAAVKQGRQRPATALAPEPQPLTDMQKRTYKAARQALNICAREAGIAAPMLAVRKELEQLACGERDVRTLQDWRAEVAGNAIVDVIEGRRKISGSGDAARLI